jgi:hypothetical protein
LFRGKAASSGVTGAGAAHGGASVVGAMPCAAAAGGRVLSGETPRRCGPRVPDHAALHMKVPPTLRHRPALNALVHCGTREYTCRAMHCGAAAVDPSQARVPAHERRLSRPAAG